MVTTAVRWHMLRLLNRKGDRVVGAGAMVTFGQRYQIVAGLWQGQLVPNCVALWHFLHFGNPLVARWALDGHAQGRAVAGGVDRHGLTRIRR